jgi:hypothetical protein
MAVGDGILDLDLRIGKGDSDRKFFSTGSQKYNPRTKIYYNSNDDVIKIEEILYAGTANEVTYSQTFNYIPAVSSGTARVTIIEPWQTGV